jgi:hypothetical protein
VLALSCPREACISIERRSHICSSNEVIIMHEKEHILTLTNNITLSGLMSCNPEVHPKCCWIFLQMGSELLFMSQCFSI